MIAQGGEPYLLYCAWRYGNENPYYLYNGPHAPPPKSWWRVRLFIYGCGEFAQREDAGKTKLIAGMRDRE